MNRWAVFDVDGTLLPGTSMERLAFPWLFLSGKLSIAQSARYLLGMARQSFGHDKSTMKRDKSYLKGIPVNDIREFGKKFVLGHIRSRLSPEGIACLDIYRQKGFKVMLMSGSPDFLTHPLQEMLQTDYLISTHLQHKNGILTGAIEGVHPYGETKADLLLHLIADLDIDFSSSIVFANDHTDAAHMRLFGTAVAVNPTESLKKIAAKEHWKIEVWR